MPNTQELNEKNITFIKNAIDIKEIEDYKNTYNIDLLYYIPFLSNTSNIDIYSITSENLLDSTNIVSKNGSVVNIKENINDLITNINGYYNFKNSSIQKDLYYIKNYNTEAITTEDGSSFNYITEDAWYNFMFLFSTDTLTPRTIAILNNSVILSINEDKRLSVKINLINTDYNELYTIFLQSQSSLKINRTTQISVAREQYIGSYKFSLFVNGIQSHSQITELDYNELNFIDQSNKIYEDSIQTLFWFHEEPGIETNIDELYLFSAPSISSYFPIPTNYSILPLPADIINYNKTQYNYNLNYEKKFNSYNSIIINKTTKFNLRRELISNTYINTKRNIVSNNSDLLPKNITYRNIKIVDTKKYNLKFYNIIDIDISIKIKRLIKKIIINKNIVEKRIIEKIKIFNNTNRLIEHQNIKTLYYLNRQVLNDIEQKYIIYKYLEKDITIKNSIFRNVIKDIIIKNNTNKIYANLIKISYILNKNVLKIINVKFNTTNNFSIKVTNKNNTIIRNVINIDIKNNLKRNIYYIMKLYSKTKFRNSDMIDVYYSSTNRKISSIRTYIFDKVLISRLAIDIINNMNTIKNINCIINNLKNTARLIKKKNIVNSHTVLCNIARDLWLNNTNKKIEKVIITKCNTLREVKPRHLTWVFVIRTD